MSFNIIDMTKSFLEKLKFELKQFDPEMEFESEDDYTSEEEDIIIDTDDDDDTDWEPDEISESETDEEIN